MRNPANAVREFGLRFEEAAQDKARHPRTLGAFGTEADEEDEADEWAAAKCLGLVVSGVALLSVVIAL